MTHIQHGRGVMIYSNSSDPDNKIEEKYEGEWVDGKMHGRGIYYYSDGTVYDGTWAEGKMHGKGVFVYPNGNKYDGEFYVSLISLSLSAL